MKLIVLTLWTLTYQITSWDGVCNHKETVTVAAQTLQGAEKAAIQGHDFKCANMPYECLLVEMKKGEEILVFASTNAPLPK